MGLRVGSASLGGGTTFGGRYGVLIVYYSVGSLR